jgi:hypothetical protein
MPKKLKPFSAVLIPVDREGVDIHLVWGRAVSRKTVAAYAEEIGYPRARLPKGASGVCFSVEDSENGPAILLALAFDWVGDAYQHGVLAHEIFHAVEGIKRFIGVRYRPAAGEDWAYLIGDLVSSAVKALET